MPIARCAVNAHNSEQRPRLMAARGRYTCLRLPFQAGVVRKFIEGKLGEDLITLWIWSKRDERTAESQRPRQGRKPWSRVVAQPSSNPRKPENHSLSSLPTLIFIQTVFSICPKSEGLLLHVCVMKQAHERAHSEENEDCSLKKQRGDSFEVELVSLDFINAVDTAVAQAAAEKAKPRALPLLGICGLQLRKNFLSHREEHLLMCSIDKCVWNTSLQRRTQHYGHVYDYKSKDVAKVAPPIPDWCTFIVERLLDQSVLLVRPDQLIVNEYEPGQGIFPHVDSTSSFEDGIVSISLISDIIMDFVNQKTNERKEALLPRCSALSLHDVARYEWRHGITARKTDHGVKRGRRVSLTFRKIK